MQRRADESGVHLRPHIKTHKSLHLARRQIAVGAVGVTASKPSEALIFVKDVEIEKIARAEAADLLSLKARIEAAGIEVPCLSVGSTPTCLGAAIPSGIDEIRPGNYAVLDRTALRLGLCAPDDLAISVVATVVSRNSRYAIIDAGSNAIPPFPERLRRLLRADSHVVGSGGLRFNN